MTLVNNRTEHTTMTSDLVYPLSKGYKLIAKLDSEFVRMELSRLFDCLRIGNKYAVDVDGKLWYQHDNNTWLIELR